MSEPDRSSAWRRGLFATVAGLYLLSFPYHPGLRSPNELCRLWQTRALVDHGTLDLNQTLRELGPVGDLSVKDGRYFPSKAPLLSFLATPVYQVERWFAGPGVGAVSEVSQVFWSRLVLTVLPTLLLLVFLRRFLAEQLSPFLADVLVVAYATGTLAFSYSLQFLSHQATAVLLFFSFFSLWRGLKDGRAWRFVLSGAFAGATVAAEYTGALGVLGLFLFAAIATRAEEAPSFQERLTRGLKRAALATAGALPFLVFLLAYHQAAFGHPLHSGYKYLADAAYQPWHVGGFLGIRLPDVRAFFLSFFSPLRGFFVLSPFLALSLFGLRAAFRAKASDRPLAWLSLLLFLGYTYFTSSFSYESWGWTTGPRHMTPLVPFLLLPVGTCLAALQASPSFRAPALLGVAAGLLAASVLNTGLLTGVNYIPDDVSNGLFGLALPLYRDGFFPPTVAVLLGGNSAWPGALFLVAVTFVAVSVAIQLARPSASRVFAGATLVLYFGLLALTARGDDHDLAAQKFLKSVWVVRPTP